jgi:RHS repeat-associated protein
MPLPLISRGPILLAPPTSFRCRRSGSLGTETFLFDINAGMALAQITDFSGNVTRFDHADAWSAPATYLQVLSGVTLNGHYDDPTKQTDALGNTKTFTYYGGNRIMQSVTDENGSKTYYDIDSLGRRTTEKIYAPPASGGALVQETDFAYGNAAYPGFMTQKTVKALSGGSDPTWVKSLVTSYTPDSNGRVAQETVDPGGLNLVTTYTYDANGNKLTSTDPKGHTTWFSYDSRNRLITVTNADGSQKQMVYDMRGNKSIEYDENGIATLYQYDQLNRLTAQARHMTAGSAQSLLNAQGDITAIPGTDITTSYTYNAVNSKLTTTSPIGGVTTMQYDNLQRVTQITDALNNVTTFQYGANSGGNAFDGSSFKPTRTTDPRGIVTNVYYDALYRPLSKGIVYDSNGDTSWTSMSYDGVGNVVATVDPLGNKTATTYDALNRPRVTTAADTSTTQQFYTSTGFRYKVIDQNNNVTQTQFDNAGRPTQVTQPQVYDQASNSPLSPVTHTYYDAAGNVIETVDPLNFVWDYAYDARNRKVQEFAPSVQDASNGNAWSRPMTTWIYDPAGRVTATIDARGNETDTVYDAANRVSDVNAPQVPVAGGSPARPNTHTTYDNDGNVLTLRDPNGHTTTNTYDLLNRLTRTVDAANDTVSSSYDAVGNRILVIDGNGNSTGFAYDGLNRNTQVTDASGKATRLKYDALNKVQRTDALGQVTTYFYDTRNRLQYVLYNSTNTNINPARTYGYDFINLLNVTESGKGGAANAAYTYDALNRVSTETSRYATSSSVTHQYYYDLAGNRLKTVYGGTNRTITSTYDALNRLATMTENSRVTSYGYDLNGNIAKKTLPNGDVETQTFDALNRASTQSAAAGAANGGGSLYSFTYGYDLASNVATVGETYPSGLNNRTVTNTYDNINRLQIEAVAMVGGVGSVTTTYGYDPANNRTSKTISGYGLTTNTTNYSYNNLNQLLSWTLGSTTDSYTYDSNGNRATRIIGSATDTYSYDFENRLVNLVKNTTGGGAGTYNYTYDYRTRRIVRDESSAGGGVADIVFSGGTSAQEYTGSITQPHLAVEYLRGSDYGGGVGGILYTIRGGNPSYTHENKRGDVVAKTNGSGALTFQDQYDGSGVQVAMTGATSDRQKDNSKDTDPWGGINEGMRYTTLEGGLRVFLTKDPAGFVDGPNLYTYVIQNPWTSFDPEGLQTPPPPPEEEAPSEDAADTNPIDEQYRESQWYSPARQPIFGSEEYEKENPPPSQAPSGPTPTISLPGGPTLNPQTTLKSDDEIALEVAKEMEAERAKPDQPGAESQKKETDQKNNEVGSSTPPTPQKPAADQIKDLGPVQGKTQAEIEAQLKAEGYTPTPAKNGGTIWTKPGSDGKTSAIRLDPPNPKAPPGNADSVEHAHKETVPSDKVNGGNYKPKDAQTHDDSGNPTDSKDYTANHIPTKPSSNP